MRVVLFDLGQTLEDDGALLPGSRETLAALAAMRDAAGEAPVVALVSDYYPAASPAEAEAHRQRYYRLLNDLGLDTFFTPLPARVTLSTDAGVEKPDEKIFRLALDKIRPGLPFTHAVFVTESAEHVRAARELGMAAIRVLGPGQAEAGIPRLDELLPHLERLLAYPPCGRKKAARTASQAGQSKQPDPSIKLLADKVDTARMRESVARLTKFKTRWSFAAQVAQVPPWIHEQFVSRGYAAGTEVHFQEFEMPGAGTQRNVLCGRPNGGGFVLVCAHYDSLSEKPSVSAPGADDNACGVAALLELSRLLRGVPLKRGVLFAAFGGEEQGLFGSTACAQIAARDGWPIDLVINLDMISFRKPGGPPRIVVEYDQGNAHPANDAASRAFALTMAQAAADYTPLAVEHANIERSDYMPFEAEGFACIGVYNADENPAYHTTSDTLDKIDFSFLREVVRMVLATVVTVSA